MLRQITLIEFKDGTTEEDILRLSEGFADLVNIVPGMHRFQFGPDLGLEQATSDYALVIDFENAEAWRNYRQHPQHIDFASNATKIIARVTRSQYEVSD